MMQNPEKNNLEIEKIIKSNFSGKIFNIFSNYGSFIQIDFSEKEANGNNIFVYMCSWNIYHNDVEILNNNDDRAKFSRIFDILVHRGMRIVDFLFDPIKHMFIFYLCDNYSISLFPDNEYLDDDMVMFFTETNYALCYSVQKGFYTGK